MADLPKTDVAEYRREAAAARARLRDDPQRPRYHFLPPGNWMNDPNGLIQWRGRYHLFYQHNPHGPLWGNMHWGHAVSDDLVRWTDLPLALAPTPGSYDQDGVYSGCAVDNGGVPIIIYTGVRGRDQLVCLATGDDELLTWRKWAGNPVIPERPPGLDILQYRDPSVWREGNRWYMVHGAGITGVGGAALLYRSPDLVDWEYLGPIHTGDLHRREPVWTGSMWECPQLFPLGDKHILLVAVWHERALQYAAYTIGAFANGRFTPAREGILDAGLLYAPQTMRDGGGRRVLFGWLREGRGNEAMQAAGWSGVMSLPWILTLRDDGALGVAPAPELESLRGAHREYGALGIDRDADVPLPDVAGDCLELDAEFAPGDAREVGLTVRRTPGGEEETRIVYEPGSGGLVVDRARSSADPAVERAAPAATLALAPGEPLRLRVFLDRSVIEIFANERLALTERIYPTRADSLGVGLFARGGGARLRRLDAWRMGAIWPGDDGRADGV